MSAFDLAMFAAALGICGVTAFGSLRLFDEWIGDSGLRFTVVFIGDIAVAGVLIWELLLVTHADKVAGG